MPIPFQTSWVDLVEFDPINRSGFIRLRAFLKNGVVEFDGDKNLTEELKKGIDGLAGNPVIPDDGILFLDQLTKTFRNPYLLATGIQTGVLPIDFGRVDFAIFNVA